MGINTIIVKLKEDIVQLLNDSHLPPVIVDMVLGDVKGVVSAEAARVLNEERAQEENNKPKEPDQCVTKGE